MTLLTLSFVTASASTRPSASVPANLVANTDSALAGAQTTQANNPPSAVTSTSLPFTITDSPPAAPQVTGFLPASGWAGSIIMITGSNLIGATAVAFNGRAAAGFIVDSATLICAFVPSGAASGPIAVSTAAGTSMSASTFTVAGSASAPQITAFVPASGPVGIRVLVTFACKNLSGYPTALTFNGLPATFTRPMGGQIDGNHGELYRTSVPTGAVTGPITVTVPEGTATSASSFIVTPSTPAITSFLPTSGPATTVVWVDGVNLAGATAVRFNGQAAADFEVLSDTRVSATVPAAATSGPISVTTPGGTATSAASFELTPPTITSVLPASGLPGSNVTITGTDLWKPTAVTFNGLAAASFAVVSAGPGNSIQIRATVPNGATSGPISVTAPTGTATSPLSFTVISPAPAITSCLPSSGPAGTLVTITGSNLTGATAVTFNGLAAASFSVVSATQITATVPAGATSGPIRVTTPGGTATSATSFTVNPAGPAAPQLGAFLPTSGPAGTLVTITGSNLTGATAVTFNGLAAASFSVVSATQITATVPAGATSGPIGVATPGGVTSSIARFTVTSPALPTITIDTVAPGTLVKTGTSMWLRGGVTPVDSSARSIAWTIEVRTGSTWARVKADRATLGFLGGALRFAFAFKPTKAGNYRAMASFYALLGGPPTSSDWVAFRAITQQPKTPVITGFSPSRGRVGTAVTISGRNFSGASSVTFGGKAANFHVRSSTSIFTAVPSGARSGEIRVTTPRGTGVSPGRFVVTAR